MYSLEDLMALFYNVPRQPQVTGYVNKLDPMGGIQNVGRPAGLDASSIARSPDYRPIEEYKPRLGFYPGAAAESYAQRTRPLAQSPLQRAQSTARSNDAMLGKPKPKPKAKPKAPAKKKSVSNNRQVMR